MLSGEEVNASAGAGFSIGDASLANSWILVFSGDSSEPEIELALLRFSSTRLIDGDFFRGLLCGVAAFSAVTATRSSSIFNSFVGVSGVRLTPSRRLRRAIIDSRLGLSSGFLSSSVKLA